MMRADVHHTNLMDLVAQVKAGHWVTLEKHGKAVAQVVPPNQNEDNPAHSTKKDRIPGSMKGKIHIHENFDDPLPEEIAKVFSKWLK